MLWRYLALWPSEVGRVYGLLEMASRGERGCPDHGTGANAPLLAGGSIPAGKYLVSVVLNAL